MKTKKRLLSILLSIVMVLGLMPGMSMMAFAADAVNYREASWNTASKAVDYTGKSVTEYTVVAENMDTTWSGGWYVVNSNVTIADRITINGTVNLILCDGCTLTASQGINVYDSNVLNIYAQSEGSNKGKLTAAGNVDGCAGIGGRQYTNSGNNCGTITIHGGNVSGTASGTYAAGIGGGNQGNGGKITIFGGNIYAKGAIQGSGIGGGGWASGGTTIIYGGIIDAHGGGQGAGIGGGHNSAGGFISIYGGKITANGYYAAAGIGGGCFGAGGTITIDGGQINAYGGSGQYGAAGIGGGHNGGGGTININGGDVFARNATANAGIGAGTGTNHGTLNIASGMTVRAGTGNDANQPCLDYPTTRSKSVHIWPHTHSDITYNASGNTLTGKCSATSTVCSFINNQFSLSLNADNAVYDGNSHGGKLAYGNLLHGVSEFKVITGQSVSDESIEYYKGEAKLDSMPVNVGSYTAKMTVSLGGTKYTISKDYQITPKPVTISGITAEDKVYDGTTDAMLNYDNVVIDGKLEGDTLRVSAVGTFVSANANQTENEKRGVTISDLALDGNSKDNYVLAAQGQQTSTEARIERKSLTDATVTLDNTQLTYNSQEQTVNVTGVTIDNLTLSESDYTVSGNTGTDTKDYTTTVTGTGNFKDSAAADWKIVEKAMTVESKNVEVTYDGKDHGIIVNVTDPASGAEIKYGRTEGTYDLDDSPTIADVKDGPLLVYYKVTAANYIDYTGSATVTINNANAVAATVTPNDRTYDGTEKPLVNVTGEANGGEMQYALGTDDQTAPSEGWGTDIPKATNAGTYYVWYKVFGDENHLDSEPACIKVVVQSGEYAVLKVENAEHTINSGENAVITVKRSTGDDRTFSLYTGAAMDGTPIASGNCDTAPGSLILTLKANYLDSLSVGDHKLTIAFQDGSVDTTVKILPAAPASTAAPTAAPTSTPKPVPKTGDTANLALWLALILLGLLGIGGLTVSRIMSRRNGSH